MKLLYAMGISEPIRVKCYETFIESILKYHLPTVCYSLTSGIEN